MIRHKSNRQLSLDLFSSPFSDGLSPDNRWVKLAGNLPWDRLSAIYYRKMSAGQGTPCKDGRVVVGAVIIKHKLKLSDREVIEQVRENPYLQYFLGFECFRDRKIFHPTLFPKIRGRLGIEEFEAMNDEILVLAGMLKSNHELAEDELSARRGDEGEGDEGSGDPGGGDATGQEIESPQDQGQLPKSEPEPEHKGKLLIDAVVIDQMIKYPTDLDLLNDSREQAERLIDLLYEPVPGQLKPRTYRRVARKEYLKVAKLKKKSGSTLRKALRKQLGYLRRDLEIIGRMLEAAPGKRSEWSPRDGVIHDTIGKIYAQQLEMYQNRARTCPERIVSIYQPWVRPMVTGKAFPRTQFGPKLSVSLLGGYSSVFRIGWNNFHEGLDLGGQVKAYKARFGYYPEVVIADQKYGTRENRRWLKQQGKGIRFSGKALGRPKKSPTEEELALKQLKAKENRMRSQIEGKFGQGKNGYGMRKCRAKLQVTTESWLAAIFFTMNLVKFLCLNRTAGLHRHLPHTGMNRKGAVSLANAAILWLATLLRLPAVELTPDPPGARCAEPGGFER